MTKRNLTRSDKAWINGFMAGAKSESENPWNAEESLRMDMELINKENKKSIDRNCRFLVQKNTRPICSRGFNKTTNNEKLIADCSRCPTSVNEKARGLIQ